MNDTLIFSIQRASFVDGPGIRTTVFFKGCNLNCVWCHNPESKSLKQQLLVYQHRCVQCGACLRACTAEAILPNFMPNKNKCLLCGKCVKICPHNARELCGMSMTIEEVFAEIIADKDFYGNDGGATFSGGECMLHLPYLRMLLTKCREVGISTAIDTAGYVSFEKLACVEEYVDWFLYDIKAYTAELHQRLTGVSNRLILENYKRLQETCSEKLIVRIPIIPAYNESDMPQIAAFLKQYPPKMIELLPYHTMGISKSEALGEAPFETRTPDTESINRLHKLFSIKGVEVI